MSPRTAGDNGGFFVWPRSFFRVDALLLLGGLMSEPEQSLGENRMGRYAPLPTDTTRFGLGCPHVSAPWRATAHHGVIRATPEPLRTTANHRFLPRSLREAPPSSQAALSLTRDGHPCRPRCAIARTTGCATFCAGKPLGAERSAPPVPVGSRGEDARFRLRSVFGGDRVVGT